MTKNISSFKNKLSKFVFNASASKDSILSLRHLNLPLDYLEFIALTNGGEGFVGDNYLVLWKAEELETFNKEFEVDVYAKGLFLFGGDGGGEGFGFDMRSQPYKIVLVPYIGMSLNDAIVVADNFTLLLDKMTESKPLF